jgi:hypothetical protein
MPATPEAMAAVSTDYPDFTFGTWSNNVQIAPLQYSIKNGNTSSTYQAYNSEVLFALRGDKDNTNSLRLNPRSIPFYTPKMAATTSDPGLGPDGVLRDIWGHPYIITLDLNYDEKVLDPYYAAWKAQTEYQNSRADKTKRTPIPGSVAVWSFGPDGKVDLSDNAGLKMTPKDSAYQKNENFDNIYSWQ